MKYEFNNENLDKIMQDFGNLTLSSKKEKIIEDLKFLIDYQAKLCELNNKRLNSIDSKDIEFFNSKLSSENDFLDTIYTYLYILKSANYDFINALSQNMIQINDMWQQ